MRDVFYKKAETAAELKQIEALNHRVFAEEIAQHAIHESGLLIDRLAGQSVYFVALRGGKLIGMISANEGPLFSVTKRLPDAAMLAAFPRPIEVRLLAIDAQERRSTILAGLLWQTYVHAKANGFTHVLISGIVDRESMYRKLGFRALGPAVREGSACFVPMVRDIGEQSESAGERVHLHARHWLRIRQRANPISLLPGPVCLHPSVAEAFAGHPTSHRSAPVIERFERAKSILGKFVPGAAVAILPGSGTLANDAVAANLKAIYGEVPGLIVSNGEFGERLANQASAAGLRFRHIKFNWGRSWSTEAVEDALANRPAWVWAVQLETSTGVLNDTDALVEAATRVGCSVALDCVSGLGATRIAATPERIFFVTGVSGKSLGAYPGLAFVFTSVECRDRLKSKLLPPSFDVLTGPRTAGPTSTVPSSTVFALAAALEHRYSSEANVARCFREYDQLGRGTRRLMRQAGLEPLAPEAVAAPNITTFVLPEREFAASCLQAGYQIAHESPYLMKRGWGQIATMGDITLRAIEALFAYLRQQEDACLSIGSST